VFAYIGPNGSGKTTTFRILCGLLDPTSGAAYIDGKDVTGNKDLIKQLVGYLPDNFGVYPTLRVWEYLDFFAAAYKIPKKQRAERIDKCLTIANADFRDKFMGGLSRGMKQRVGIAKTLLHDPKVIILDEPAATLDPRARVAMRDLLRDLAKLGKAVLVSSHILPELADVADTVGIVSKGNLIASGPVQEILRNIRQKRLIEITVLKFKDQAKEVLAGSPGDWTPVEETRSPIACATRQRRRTADGPDAVIPAQARHPGDGVREVQADLEDVFMTLTK
jgi:ABC-2 type transport system ATP-binding protein